MEEDKKKKRNKKKKNKQNKASEDDAPPAAVASADHASNDLNTNGANVVSDAQRGNGFDEAVMKEEISRLREENESHLRKEVGLEEKIRELQDRNDSHVQKQTCLQADLEEKIGQLSIEKVSYLQKEADLETKISQLQREKGLWLEKENASNETIAKQNIDITRLRMQVVELEENKDNLSKENRLLVERQSDLQSTIQNLETSLTSAVEDSQKDLSNRNDLNGQIEAAHALVKNLATENAELVEKVNELYAKLDRNTTTELDPSSSSSSSIENDDTLVRNAELVATESVKDEGTLEPLPPETDSEIVQVPVNDEIETELDFEQQTVERDHHEKENVPLSDSPLIGAPFRLFSFVASYVSGADLVGPS
ncbi:hypothetical protein LINGRAHAP2_LOCUS13100 [Linum grandiflorum]